jgi:hypothetical protein
MWYVGKLLVSVVSDYPRLAAALNEKEIVHDFGSFHYCIHYLSFLAFRLVSPDGS